MKAPELRIIDTNFQFLSLLGSYSSLQWTRKLYEVGEIEIHAPYSSMGAEFLLPENIVYFDEEHAAILTGTIITESKSGVEVVAKGKQLKGIADFRITVPNAKSEQSYYGYDRYPDTDEPDAPAESVLKHYALAHMITPEDANRAFPNLIMASDLQRGMTMRWSSRFETLSDCLKSIGEWSGIGYDISLDLSNKKFVFDAIVGANRTKGSESPVLFASMFQNVSQTQYTVDEKAWNNAAYAGGNGEDENRLIQAVYQDDKITVGFNRREAWFDCGSIDNVSDLTYEAKYKLKDKMIAENLTGSVTNTGPFLYRRDWDLGDMVTVQNSVIGIELDVRITEVKESYEQGKHSIQPVFGKRTKNILDEIRKNEVVR